MFFSINRRFDGDRFFPQSDSPVESEPRTRNFRRLKELDSLSPVMISTGDFHERTTRVRSLARKRFLAFVRTFRPRASPGQKRSATRARASPTSLVLERGKRRLNERQASASTGMMSRGLHQANAPDLSTANVGGLRAQPATALIFFRHEELVNV